MSGWLTLLILPALDMHDTCNDSNGRKYLCKASNESNYRCLDMSKHCDGTGYCSQNDNVSA